MMSDASSLYALYAKAGAISTAGDRGQLARWEAQSAEDQLQKREQQRGLLSSGAERTCYYLMSEQS